MPTNPLRLNPLTGKHVWNHDHRERHDTFASEAASVTAAAAASSPTEEWPYAPRDSRAAARAS
eukprot:5706981-Prymnesium_polylepis.1